MSSALQVLTIARAEIGVKESPANSNKVKYAKEYGMNGQPWCAMFVWWVFKHAGCPELFYGGKKSAYCPTIADYYIAKKQTVSKKSGQAGDIVLFDWNGGQSDHIGIIESKNADGSYNTIEGNTSLSNNANGGMVMRRKRKQSEISWIARPKYTEESEPTEKQIVVDGEWGEDTTRASQHVMGTIEDGEVSGQLNKHKKYLINCNTNSWEFVKSSKNGSDLIKAIQKLVGLTGKAVNGKADKKTVIAVQKFLQTKGYYKGAIDGYMGVLTVKGWQKYINKRLKGKV